MTTTQISATPPHVKSDQRYLADYFRRCRANQIANYKHAEYWIQRRDARSWALHYGRLIRKMEGRA